MATTENTRSLYLANAFPRLLTSGNANILLGVSAPLFYVGTDSTPNIPEITISAQLIALDGIVTFNCVGGTLTSVANNSAILTYANMSADIATITASLVYRGVTFTSKPVKITKVLAASGTQGTNGLSNSVVYAFQRSATIPTGSPGDITYNFASGAIVFPTTLANGWSKVIPAGTDPLYVTTASASGSASTDSIAGTEWSSPVILAQNGTQGLSVATVYIYQRTASNTAPPLPGTSSVFTFSTGAITGLTNGWTSAVPAASAGGYLWVSTSTASNTTATDTILSSEWAAAQLLSQDGQGAGTPGTNGNSVATVTLYQWSTVLPANPTGTATLTWASGATTAYSGNDGWYISAPANPGSPGIKLFIASTQVTAPAGTTSSTATFGSAQIVALSQNGAAGTQGIPGLKTANVSAYQWSLSGPTTTGTTTYNWFQGTYDTPPATGWSINKTNAPGSGYTLYEASVRLVDSTGATTSNIDWSMANVAGIAYQGTSGGAGSQGASAKRAYVLINGSTLAQSPTFVTRPGTAYPVTGTWGETNDWQATPPTPTAGQAVFQADGIFDPVTNQTVWNVPYLSNLKVGSLSALTLGVMGNITSGSMDIGSGSASWHVDSSGNQWAGAATYAAAPFKVSNTGNMLVKSLLVQAIDGTTILDPTGLKAGFEAPGTKNSEIALGGRNLIAKNSLPTSDTGFVTTNPFSLPIEGDASIYAGAGSGYSDYSPLGAGCVYMHVTGLPLGGTYITMVHDAAGRVPVINGKRYEFSVALSTHRCSAQAIVAWFSAAGAYMSEVGGNSVDRTPAEKAWAQDFPRSLVMAVAPAGAVSAQVFVRQYHNGSDIDPTTFTSQWYFGEASAAQVAASTWSASPAEMASGAAAGKYASEALPGIGQAISDKLSKTSPSDLAATVTIQTGGTLLVGTPTNGLYINGNGLYLVQGNVVKGSLPISGDPTFAGQLMAAFGSFGAVSIAAGGKLTVGVASSFGDEGVFLGYVGNVAKMSIVSGGVKFLYDPSDSQPLQIINPSIAGLALPTMTANLSGTNITSNGPSNQTRNLGTRQITTTGGSAPYTYNWTTTMLEGGGLNSYITLAGTDTDTVTVTAKGGTDVSLIASIVGTITGADGRSASKAFRVTANFGNV